MSTIIKCDNNSHFHISRVWHTGVHTYMDRLGLDWETLDIIRIYEVRENNRDGKLVYLVGYSKKRDVYVGWDMESKTLHPATGSYTTDLVPVMVAS